MRRRRLRLRKKVYLFIVILSLVFIGMLIKNNYKKEPVEEKKDYISFILSKSEGKFDKKFLLWIQDNYSDKVLEKVFHALDNGTYNNLLWHDLTGNSYYVLMDLYRDNYKDLDNVKIVEGKRESIDIGYAGDVSLADNWTIMPHYNSKGKGVFDILSKEMVDYINNLDWMIINSEFAFSNRGEPIPNKLYTFRAKTDNVGVYEEMGIDMVTLANNHVYDYGKDAFFDTLNTLKSNNIPYIGAGIDDKEAQDAYYLVINGYKISFLNATRAEKYILTPEATSSSEGVFRCYDPNRLVERIKEEKEKSDYVVAIVHWGKENTHELENVQKETGRLYIDSGADMVIGHHAHMLQGVEFYKGKLIAYNLGNFIFNDCTVDTGVLIWKLLNDGSSEFYFFPGLQSNSYTDVVKESEALDLYKKMSSWSINASFLENGKIVEN